MYLFASRRTFLSWLPRCAAGLIAAVAHAAAFRVTERQSQSSGTKKKDDGASAGHDSGGESQEPVYEPGGDVKPPKLIHYVEPQFSPSSKEAFVEGTVKLATIVTTDGIPTNLKIVSGLNTQEDQTAVEAVKQWRFQPGTKAGQPVKVRVTVEVAFHLL